METKSRWAMPGYNYAFLDEGSKREIRRKALKAVCIPGYQVPFASRELPIARGWGTGGLQLTLALLGPDDCVKVIDQGSDDSVNAVSIRKLIQQTTAVVTTQDTTKATIIQSRHRIPDTQLTGQHTLVLQVPQPEPLRRIEPQERVTRQMHAEQDYSGAWLPLYEDLMKWGEITIGADFPVRVNQRYVMAPTPIPRWDLPKIHQAPFLTLFGAGRERKIYAVPPYTDVIPLQFDDHPFCVERFEGRPCVLCGSRESFLEQTLRPDTQEWEYRCADTDYCRRRQIGEGKGQ